MPQAIEHDDPRMAKILAAASALYAESLAIAQQHGMTRKNGQQGVNALYFAIVGLANVTKLEPKVIGCALGAAVGTMCHDAESSEIADKMVEQLTATMFDLAKRDGGAEQVQ